MTSLEFMQGPGTSPLPADWYLIAFPLLTVLTEILRFVETLQRVSKSAEVGPRRTMVSFIGMLTLVHPFATTWHFPSRGNEKFRGAFRLSADRPRMTVGGVKVSWITSIMGWPLDSVILNAVKNLGARRG